MTKNTSVISYLGIGNPATSGTKGATLRISATKQELAFRPFIDSSSRPSVLARLAAEDKVLRTLFFLKSRISFAPSSRVPIVVSIPFFVHYDESFLDSLVGESKSDAVKQLEKERDELSKEVNASGQATFVELLRLLVQEKRIVEAFSSRRRSLRGEEEFERTIAPWVKEREERILATVTKWTDSTSKAFSFASHTFPILQAMERLGDARSNSNTLAAALNKANPTDELVNSLSKLSIQNVFSISNESVCLECKFKKSLSSYHISEFDVHEPRFVVSCPKCQGRSVLHEVSLVGTSGFGPLLQEKSMSEIIIAETLARTNLFEKIFVHKRISPFVGGLPAKSAEVDVLCVAPNRLVAIELTTSSDLNLVVQNLNRKEEVLESIPLDYLIYVTACPDVERYIEADAGVYLTGAKHLPGIDTYVKYILENGKPMKSAGGQAPASTVPS